MTSTLTRVAVKPPISTIPVHQGPGGHDGPRAEPVQSQADRHLGGGVHAELQHDEHRDDATARRGEYRFVRLAADGG